MCKPLTILEEKGNNTREQTAKDGQKVDFFLLWDESYFENSYRTRSVISLLSSIVPLSNIVPQKLEKNINLEGKNKALSDIVRTLQKLKEIQAADSNRSRTVSYCIVQCTYI